VRPPPGLEFLEPQDKSLSPSGLPKPKICITLTDEIPEPCTPARIGSKLCKEDILDTGSDYDDTSAGSGYASSEPESSTYCDSDGISSGLVLEEKTSLNANSRSFVPMLTPAVATALMPDVVQRTPLRKLNSKATAYIPMAMQSW
jgi:hypothetical protein